MVFGRVSEAPSVGRKAHAVHDDGRVSNHSARRATTHTGRSHCGSGKRARCKLDVQLRVHNARAKAGEFVEFQAFGQEAVQRRRDARYAEVVAGGSWGERAL